MLKGYGSIHRVEDLTLGLTGGTIKLGTGELPVGMTIGFLRTQDTYKSFKAITKSFSTCGITFWSKLLQG
jgi:hypothetical protein